MSGGGEQRWLRGVRAILLHNSSASVETVHLELSSEQPSGPLAAGLLGMQVEGLCSLIYSSVVTVG